MSENQEKARDLGNAQFCAVCGEKLGKLQKFMDKNYEHKLFDAAPCQKCDKILTTLLLHLKCWVDPEEYKQTVGRTYRATGHYEMPLEKAKALLALRDTVSSRALNSIGLPNGSVFMVLETFQMPPSPAIFILRARKVRNRQVVKGFILKGGIKKNEAVMLPGGTDKIKVLDAIPVGTKKFSKETFFDELGTNLHSHSLSECEEGWLILDTQEPLQLTKGTFIAGC